MDIDDAGSCQADWLWLWLEGKICNSATGLRISIEDDGVVLHRMISASGGDWETMTVSSHQVMNWHWPTALALYILTYTWALCSWNMLLIEHWRSDKILRCLDPFYNFTLSERVTVIINVFTSSHCNYYCRLYEAEMEHCSIVPISSPGRLAVITLIECNIKQEKHPAGIWSEPGLARAIRTI